MMRYLVGPPPPPQDGPVSWTEMPPHVRQQHLQAPASVPFRLGADPAFFASEGGANKRASTASVKSEPRPSLSSSGSTDSASLRSSSQSSSFRSSTLIEQDEPVQIIGTGQAVKEGRLLLRKTTGPFKPYQAVLTPAQLLFFLPTKSGAVASVELATVTTLQLRAATDYAIEMVAGGTLYHMLADTHLGAEQWLAAVLRYCHPRVREKMLPQAVDIFVPALGDRVQVGVTVTTRVCDVLAQLSGPLNRATVGDNIAALCLRRGERVVWLDGDDLILSSPVIFKSHTLECRPASHRQAMEGGMTTRANPPDEIVGFLQKQGADGVVRAWRRRWFFTRAENLFYAKLPRASGDDSAGDALGFINLENATSMEHDSRNAAIFEIVVGERTYRLQAETVEDARTWLGSLRNIALYYRRHHMDQVTPWLHMEMRLESARETSAARREGILRKRGVYNTRWKERLFILADGQLAYYKASDSGQHLRGTIPLAGATAALCDDVDDRTFSIVTPTRTYMLKAASRELVEDWLVAIRHEQATADGGP